MGFFKKSILIILKASIGYGNRLPNRMIVCHLSNKKNWCGEFGLSDYLRHDIDAADYNILEFTAFNIFEQFIANNIM